MTTDVDAPFNNGNYCECCNAYGDVQLYLDSDDNAEGAAS